MAHIQVYIYILYLKWVRLYPAVALLEIVYLIQNVRKRPLNYHLSNLDLIKYACTEGKGSGHWPIVEPMVLLSHLKGLESL